MDTTFSEETLNHWYHRGKLYLQISQSDSTKAVMWLNLAANHGHIQSILLLNKLRIHDITYQ